MRGIPKYYKDKIVFEDPRTLEEAIRKAKYCYDQNKGKPDYHKAWKDKRNEKFDQRKKGFKPSNFQNQPSQDVIEPARVMREKPKNPLKCWGCEGPHLCRNCPLENRNEGKVPSTQEAETMG